MPAADDLFRPTTPDGEPAVRTSRARSAARAVDSPAVEPQSADPQPPRDVVEDAEPTRRAAVPRRAAARKPSGRVRHDEKMTVYVTSDELLDLEHARLSLRRDQGLAVDRGRLVREAVALALADLEANGEDSALVRRLLAQ